MIRTDHTSSLPLHEEMSLEESSSDAATSGGPESLRFRPPRILTLCSVTVDPSTDAAARRLATSANKELCPMGTPPAAADRVHNTPPPPSSAVRCGNAHRSERDSLDTSDGGSIASPPRRPPPDRKRIYAPAATAAQLRSSHSPMTSRRPSLRR